MKSFLKSAGVIVLGLVVGVVLIMIVEAIGHAVYPPPSDLDFRDAERVAAHIESLPTGAFLFVLLAWAVGTLAGAWVAARLAARAPLVHALIVGALLLAAGIMNMVMIPHPAWFMVVGVLVFPLSGWLGARLASRGD